MVDTFQKGQLGVRHPLRRVLRTEKDLVLPGQPLIGIPRTPTNLVSSHRPSRISAAEDAATLATMDPTPWLDRWMGSILVSSRRRSSLSARLLPVVHQEPLPPL